MFETLNESAVTSWLNGHLWGFPMAEVFHIVMTGGFFGGILLLDLRLLGFGRKVPVSLVMQHTLAKVWWLFLGVVCSGVLLFLFMPLEYAGNGPFRLKLVLIGAGGLNALFLHLVLMRGQYRWDVHADVPLGVKLSALVSVALWMGCLASGRLIAYYYGV